MEQRDTWLLVPRESTHESRARAFDLLALASTLSGKSVALFSIGKGGQDLSLV